jgi:alpha-tubulin suppressor-like RCC1 family protein
MMVSALGSVSLVKVACGNGHTVGMASNGDIFTWGKVLGETATDDSGNDWHLPDADGGLPGEAVDIAAGEEHIGAVSLTGDTYIWGHNHHGQCAKNPDMWGSRHHCLHNPARAGGALATTIARRIACGKYHTVVLSVEGAVFSFGAGMSGQLGRTCSWESSAPWQPDRVIFPTNDQDDAIHVIQIVCGDEHTVCLTDLGRAFSFGSGCYGQLGLGSVRSYRVPVPLRMRGKLSELAAGANWSLLRDRSGKVLQAGRDEDDFDDCRLLRQVLT